MMIYVKEKNAQSLQIDNFIKLIVSIVTKQAVTLTNPDIETIIRLATFQSLENLLYKSLEFNHLDIPKKFQELNQKLFYKAITQDAEKDNLIKLLRQHQIEHLLLKGAVIRDFYPSIEMRSMADLDLLVHKEELKRIKKVLLENQYQLDHTGGHHDCYQKPPFMNIEVHHALIPITNPSVHNYYRDIWKRISKKDYTLSLSHEDFYIYMIIHAAKHFSEGGIGLKVLIDIYYYTKKIDLDYSYVYQELDKVGYKKLAIILKELSFGLFVDSTLLTDDLKDVLLFLINSGTYGTFQNNGANEIANRSNVDLNSNKRKYFFHRLFPSFLIMKNKYPLLKKLPFLLPWYWFKRLICALFKFQENKKRIRSINQIDEQKIEEIKNIKRITGL